MRTIFGTFVLTAVVSLIGVPVFRMLALRVGLVDAPDGHRKLHDARVPVSGGVPVFLTCLLGVLVAILVPNRWAPALIADYQFLIALGLGSAIIVGVGLLDDSRGLRGRQKLAGQALAAGIIVAFGLRIEKIELLGSALELGVLAVPFTVFWLLGAINAFNLIDGVDGLATTLGLIISVGLAIMAVMFGHGAFAVVAIALAGSLTGFLVYNFPPARIFLGDAGSMLIGLLLGSLAIRCSLKGAATAALVVPTVIWTIPILDVAMAILRRKLTGKSLYSTDRGHLHHCLMARGLHGPRLLLGAGVLSAVAGAGALISMAMKNEYLALMSAGVVVAILVATRSFGHTELAMLARRVHRIAISLVPGLQDEKKAQVTAHLQGTGEWDGLWELLTEFAERFDIDLIELNVSLPAQGEEYHAKWSRKAGGAEESAWRSEIPLVVGNSMAGRLRVAGSPQGHDSICSWMGELITGLKPFEAQMVQLVANGSSPATTDNAHDHSPAVAAQLRAG